MRNIYIYIIRKVVSRQYKYYEFKYHLIKRSKTHIFDEIRFKILLITISSSAYHYWRTSVRTDVSNGSCARAPCVARTAFQRVKLGALIWWIHLRGLELVVSWNDAARVHLEPRSGDQVVIQVASSTDPALTLGARYEVGSKMLRFM